MTSRLIKTENLEQGMQLDLAIAMLEYPHLKWGSGIGIHHASHQLVIPELEGTKSHFSPSYNWDTGGPIIQREWTGLVKEMDKLLGRNWAEKIDPLPDLLRLHVRRKFGEEVFLPSELVVPNNDDVDLDADEKVPMYSKEWFDEAFNPAVNHAEVPALLRPLSETICQRFEIRGICDPMYIANITALELGFGDGLSTFTEAPREIEDTRIAALVARLGHCYGNILIKDLATPISLTSLIGNTLKLRAQVYDVERIIAEAKGTSDFVVRKTARSEEWPIIEVELSDGESWAIEPGPNWSLTVTKYGAKPVLVPWRKEQSRYEVDEIALSSPRM